MTGTAAENFRRGGAGIRVRLGQDQDPRRRARRDGCRRGRFPEGAEKYTINEVNFSEFPIIIVNLPGRCPNGPWRGWPRPAGPARRAGAGARGRARRQPRRDGGGGHRPAAAGGLQRHRAELINVVQNNNQLIAAGEVDSAEGASRSRSRPPSKTRATSTNCRSRPMATEWYAGRSGHDQPHLRGPDRHRALQRRDDGGAAGGQAQGLQHHRHRRSGARGGGRGRGGLARGIAGAVDVGTSNDQSRTVESMVKQLEGSVLTAIALVMIVTLAALGHPARRCWWASRSRPRSCCASRCWR